MLLRGLDLAGDTDGLGEGGLVAASASDAVVARGTSSAPGAVVGPAVVASALKGTLRVEASLLIKRDGVRAVAAAEDVSTATAVVTAIQERKGTSASGRSAQRSAVVRLPVVSRGRTSDGAHVVLIPLVGNDSGDGGRTPRTVGSGLVLIGADGRRSEAGGAAGKLERVSRHVHAAVCAARRRERSLS